MAASDAKALPVKGAIFRFPIFIGDADGDPVTGATGLDSEISKDNGAFADCTNEATEIGNGWYYLELTATEMTADYVVGVTKTSTVGAKTAPWGFATVDVGFDSLPTAAGIADAVLDEPLSGHVTAGSLGAAFVGRGPLHAGTAQSAGTSTIVLAGTASGTDDYYNGRGIVIIAGTGAGQARTITDYVGSSKQATIAGTWADDPDGTSQYRLTD